MKKEIEKLIFKESDFFVAMNAVLNPVLNSDDLIKLINSDPNKIPWAKDEKNAFLFVVGAVHKNPNANKDVIKELYNKHGKDETVRSWLCSSANTPKYLLANLSKDEESSVRFNVAGNQNTPSEILMDLSKDKDDKVRLNVANHPNTPKECLINLSWDDNIEICRAVAENPSTPINILTEMASDRDAKIRCAVAKNQNTPFEVLFTLLRDRNSDVRDEAAKNQKYTTENISVDKSEEINFEEFNSLKTDNERFEFIKNHINNKEQWSDEMKAFYVEPDVVADAELVKDERLGLK